MFVRPLVHRASRAGHRLATRLVALVVLVALLSGGAVGALVINRARQALREDILHSSLAAADLAASVAVGYMNGAEDGIRDLAGSAEVESAAVSGDLDQATPALERWLRQHPNLERVGLVDLNGTTRATSQADKSTVGLQINVERDWFQGALASGEPFLGAPGLSTGTQQPSVPYATPVRDEAGTLRAILLARISLGSLSDTLNSVPVSSNTRTSVNDIVHGVVLANVDKRRILTPVTGKNLATTMMRAGQRGAIDNINSTGQLTLAAFTPVAGLPWGVIVQEPSAQAFAPVDDMVRQVVVLIAVALVLAAAIGVGLAFGILRPIRQLRTVLEAMAGGDLTQRVRTTRQDELGELGRGFDRMADQQQQTLADLQEGEDRFHGIISAAFDGYAIHQDGHIRETSSAG